MRLLYDGKLAFAAPTGPTRGLGDLASAIQYLIRPTDVVQHRAIISDGCLAFCGSLNNSAGSTSSPVSACF
jgi:hypothetical protein